MKKTQRSPNLIPSSLLAIFLIFVGSNSLLSAQTNPNQPNVLVIIADDLGLDPLQGYLEGGIKANTPNLDLLAERGITFTNAWSPPQCAPTRAAMISGKVGAKTGVIDVPGELTTAHTSIFKELENRTNGAYADAVLGKWQLGPNNNPSHPADHGVDHYDGVILGGVDTYSDWQKTTNGATSRETQYITSYLTDQAINWIDQQTQPWFLWLAHIAPHSPFHTPPAGLFSGTANNRQTRYIAMIEAMDTEIGRLFENIAPEVLDNTVVLFIGDNGSPNNVLQTYPNNRGKATVYQGGVHVPMIVAGKGVTRQNVQDDKMVNAIDFYATILEIAGIELSGGIHNSLSFYDLLSNADAPSRPYNYAEIEGDWTIRNTQYKFLQLANGTQEFYDLLADPLESNNLINNLTVEQEAIKAELEAEGLTTRNDWSCNDLILNGAEVTVDDCGNMVDNPMNPPVSNCTNDNSTSTTNIGCCATPAFPNAYFEVVENDTRTIYSNNYPNHAFCFNPERIPEPLYNEFVLDATPEKAATTTSILRPNNRPQRFFGVALNGVIMAPSPATPFIFTNTTTGEFNWDWVFEANNNQGDGRNLVSLDCSSAHSGSQGYHYHGNMFEYVEFVQTGISTTMTAPAQPLQVGWAADGFPILYRFGPDTTGNLKLLQSSYQLKAGERPGDGISAPCGTYNGKYINDYEYIQGSGDLDQCNGIDATITIGAETFNYFYVVTEAFPQIGRCLTGTPSPTFDNGDGRGISTTPDNDRDGYVAAIDCNDNDAAIHPNSEEIAGNGLDDNCDGVIDMTTSDEDVPFLSQEVRVFPNPLKDWLYLELPIQIEGDVVIYNTTGQAIIRTILVPNQEIQSIPVRQLESGVYFLKILFEGNVIASKKLLRVVE